MTTQPAPALRPDGRAACMRIGMFDSGVGGLSVLRSVRCALPGHALHYLADSAHAPYGERDAAHVIERAMRITEHLVECGARVVVIACNTATAAAAQHLRETWPRLPFVGVEPGIKPALAASASGRIAVMATAATLASEKFRHLVATHRSGRAIHLQACTGLAAAIERGDLDDPEIKTLVEHHCQPLRAAHVDTVVLGCTHYPFVEGLIRHAMGSRVQIVDTAEAIARRVSQVIAEQFRDLPRAAHAPVLLETTGDIASFEHFARRWLPFDFQTGTTALVSPFRGARDGA